MGCSAIIVILVLFLIFRIFWWIDTRLFSRFLSGAVIGGCLGIPFGISLVLLIWATGYLPVVTSWMSPDEGFERGSLSYYIAMANGIWAIVRDFFQSMWG